MIDNFSLIGLPIAATGLDAFHKAASNPNADLREKENHFGQ